MTKRKLKEKITHLESKIKDMISTQDTHKLMFDVMNIKIDKLTNKKLKEEFLNKCKTFYTSMYHFKTTLRILDILDNPSICNMEQLNWAIDSFKECLNKQQVIDNYLQGDK